MCDAGLIPCNGLVGNPEEGFKRRWPGGSSAGPVKAFGYVAANMAAAANTATPTCERRTRIHVDSGVYYNPKHKLDRSLCVLALQAAMNPDQCPIRVNTADGAVVLDAFAGCGVRALRVSHVRC